MKLRNSRKGQDIGPIKEYYCRMQLYVALNIMIRDQLNISRQQHDMIKWVFVGVISGYNVEDELKGGMTGYF